MIMYLEKPKSSEELYNFFVKGMPLRPIKTYYHAFRRKGWNTYISSTGTINIPIIELSFYTLNKAYYPDWKLVVFKYENS